MAFCLLGLSAESLPYQDATAEMLSAPQRSIRGWQAGVLASVAMTSLAGIVFWRTRTSARAG